MNLGHHLKACLLALHIELLASSYSNQKCTVEQTPLSKPSPIRYSGNFATMDTLITQKGLEIQWFNESRC